MQSPESPPDGLRYVPWIRAWHLTRYTIEPSGCWLWTGPVQRGYGKVGFRRNGRYTSTSAHRLFYEGHIGPIPGGLDLDHICRVKLCVNPDHLDPVTNAENQRRRRGLVEVCPAGHPMTDENRRFDGRTYRCRVCIRARDTAWKREWRKENAEVIRQRNQTYYAANRERLVRRERERRSERHLNAPPRPHAGR